MKIHLKKRLIFVIPAIMRFTTIIAQNVPPKQEPGIIVSNINLKVKPNDDFFRFENGTQLDKTDIPLDKTIQGSFNELGKKTDKDAFKILGNNFIIYNSL